MLYNRYSWDTQTQSEKRGSVDVDPSQQGGVTPHSPAPWVPHTPKLFSKHLKA